MTRRTEQAHNDAVKQEAMAKPKPAIAPPDEEKLLERIERLEERLDKGVDGKSRPAVVYAGGELDTGAATDPLRRAVSRSNRKRGSRKA